MRAREMAEAETLVTNEMQQVPCLHWGSGSIQFKNSAPVLVEFTSMSRVQSWVWSAKAACPRFVLDLHTPDWSKW